MFESSIPLTLPLGHYTMPRQFNPIFNGYIYVGLADTDPKAEGNRITVYQEEEDRSLTPVAQPISINAGGFPVINGQVVKLVVTEDYSVAVYDHHDVQEFYFPYCKGPYIISVFHDQTLHGNGTEDDPLGVQLSSAEGNQLQIKDDGLYYGPITPASISLLYVASSGSDDNPGSRDKPLLTVDKALSLIAGMGISGAYTIFLKAGETFSLQGDHPVGQGTFNLTFTYFDDPTFGDIRSHDGWYPITDARLKRPMVIFDTSLGEDGLIRWNTINSSPKLDSLHFDGVSVTFSNSAGASTGGGWALYVDELIFSGSDIFITGDYQGIGSAVTVALRKANLYLQGKTQPFVADYSPDIFYLELLPEGETKSDPTGVSPDVTGRPSNIKDILTPQNAMALGTYDSKTKTTFGWGVNWDIFAQQLARASLNDQQD